MSLWPNFSTKELKAVSSVLKSRKVNYLTGDYGKLFEKKFSTYHKLKYCLAVSNGSIAIELVLKSLNLKPEDEVIVTSKSFIASASSVVLTGSKPIFCDVNIDSQNIDIKNIVKAFSSKTKAVICVHLGGWPCEMKSIVKFCKEKKLFLIEDCSQAHGAKYKDKYVGSFGDYATWSFCNDKIISTGGEGGMISTKNKKNYLKLWSLKDHGKNFGKIKNKNNFLFKYIHDNFGSNNRLTEMQSVLGIVQLDLLNQRLKIRNRNAILYRNKLSVINSLIIPQPPKYIYNAYYRLYLRLNFSKIKKNWNKQKILNKLNRLGFKCSEGACSEIYREKAFVKSKLNPSKKLKNAKELSKSSFCVLVDHTVSTKYINEQSEIAINFFKKIANS